MLSQIMNARTTLKSDYYEPYTYFSRTVRMWMVAYAIGAPVLFVSQEYVSEKISGSGEAFLITMLFLSALCIQIGSALIYKYALWFLHLGVDDANIQNSKGFLISNWLIKRLWPTVLFDISSVALFVLATYKVLIACISE